MMNTLQGLLDVAWSERLGWTIIHSIWQIAAVTAIYAGAAVWLRRSAANLRYVLGCLALVAMVCLPFATFAILDNAQTSIAAVDARISPLPAHVHTPELTANVPSSIPAREDLPSALASHEDGTNFDSHGQYIHQEIVLTPWGELLSAMQIGPFLPWISSAWLLGVVVFSARPLLGLMIVSRLRRRGLTAPSARLTELAKELLKRMRMRQSVQFAESALVQVPTVVGYLRPIVLLPASALTGLSTQELELLLAHELAHVRRQDYLINGLQAAIETILFYHPGVWWVSSQVRIERENCCDDVAVALCGSRATYVRALVAMEQHRADTPLALAASGGSLVKRAKRLISPRSPETGLQQASAWLAGLLPMSAAAVLLLLGSTIAVTGGVREAEATVVPPVTTQSDVSEAAETVVSEIVEPEPAANQAEAPASKTSDAKDGKDKTAEPAAEAPPAAKDADRKALDLSITLEDGAADPLKIVLSDRYSRSIKTWDKVAPGEVSLKLPDLESGIYSLDISAKGYSALHVGLGVQKSGLTIYKQHIGPTTDPLVLYRRRYTVLRYAVNTQGERKLTGPNVTEGRVAISYGHVPDLHGDWMIRQDGTMPVFNMHRFQPGNGFVRVAPEVKFEAIDQAPQPDQYKTAEALPAEKGMVLLTHIIGNGPSWMRYAKIEVEDITETPPKDIQVIDTLLPPTKLRKLPIVKTPQPASDRTSGSVDVTFGFEEGASAPIHLELRDYTGKTLKSWNSAGPGELRLELPELDHDRYSITAFSKGYSPVHMDVDVSDVGVKPPAVRFDLFRLRYLILRYAINTKGERNLKGENVREERVAVLFGSLPDLKDWSVGQRDGKVSAIVRRLDLNMGFASADEGSTFDELTTAPPPDDYSAIDFELKKGMVLFNRVIGHKPEMERYAKLMVEDITETLPKDLKVIDTGTSAGSALLRGARPVEAGDASQKSGTAEREANKKIQSEEDPLQGAWAIVKSVERGKEEKGITGRIEITGDKLVMTSALGGTEFKMAVDGDKKPKWIDLTFVKQTPSIFQGDEESHKGVFRIQGNTMTMLLGPADKERPTDFAAKPGEGQFLIVLQRLAPAN